MAEVQEQENPIAVDVDLETQCKEEENEQIRKCEDGPSATATATASSDGPNQDHVMTDGAVGLKRDLADDKEDGQRSRSRSPIRKGRRSLSKSRSRSRRGRYRSRSRGSPSRSRSRRRSGSRGKGGRRRRSRSRSGGRGGEFRGRGNGRYLRPSREPEPGCKLHVGNLSYGTDVSEIETRFEKFGKLTDVFIPKDSYTRRSKGFAFVTFDDPRDARDAMNDLDGIEVDGRRIMVEYARGRRRVPSRNQSYRGGSRDYDSRSRRGSRRGSRGGSPRRGGSRGGSPRGTSPRGASPIDERGESRD